MIDTIRNKLIHYIFNTNNRIFVFFGMPKVFYCSYANNVAVIFISYKTD